MFSFNNETNIQLIIYDGQYIDGLIAYANQVNLEYNNETQLVYFLNINSKEN